jgi:hypothetical protein
MPLQPSGVARKLRSGPQTASREAKQCENLALQIGELDVGL